MKLIHVVAASENRCIGLNGKMPWHLKDDLKRFKALTTGNILVMGRKTFESIGKPLPNRFSVVVSRHQNQSGELFVYQSSIDQALTVASERARSEGKNVYIVGGGEIYAQTMDMVDEIYLTRVHATLSGDAFYPEVDENEFRCVQSEAFNGDEFPVTYFHYVRVSG